MDARSERTTPATTPSPLYAFAFQGAAEGSLRSLHGAVRRALPPDARIVGARGPTIIALQRVPPGAEPAGAAASLRAAVADALGDPTLSGGIAGPRDRERSLQLVVLQAEQAVRVGRALNGHGRVTAFADLGPYCFVLGRPTEEIRTFCRAVLGPLAEQAQREELRTLEEFLRSHGSVNGVARALFLHRNTVRQRLRRIGELTGADLEDAGQRVTLYLAVLGQTALEELAS